MTLSEHDWNQLFTPIMKLVKNWMKLPKNTPSFLLFHEGCLGIDHSWKIHCINIITDLMIKLNSNSYVAIATQIRLRDAQLKSLIIDPIFDCDLHATSWIKLQAQKNVSFNALVIAKFLDISMAINLIDRSTWSISGGKELILKFFKQYQLTKGTYLMTWKQYRSLALLLVQGRTARWYRDVAHLCTSRTDNLTPLANSDAWLIGKVNKIHHHEQGISQLYPGYNDNRTIGWQDTGRVILTHCCKRAILDRVSNSRGWSFPSEWLSSTHHPDILLSRDRSPTSTPSPIINLPLVQDIWIHRWIDDDDLKSKLNLWILEIY
ncbi:hypothetical protein GLOIN_2v1785617 [Rhizophagus irregularis DAOM 181602=DAOM 197198]|nr:hypothetical protein GLOIN_2v1785617 [Rhizophagus irregularis DAOM 181602=DAOM 197198]